MRAFLISLAFQSVATLALVAIGGTNDFLCPEYPLKSCTTLIKTITPPPKTITVKTTATTTVIVTAPPTTITATKRQSETITNTKTRTVISTVKSTAVITIASVFFPTSTVPAPYGFTPVASEDTLPSVSLGPKDKRRILGRFAPRENAAAKIWKRLPGKGLLVSASSDAVCVELGEPAPIDIYCDTTSTTTLPAKTTTVTSTVIATITSTSRKPNLTSSTTSLVVTTAATTVTVTSTTTITTTVIKTNSIRPTFTVTSYAACASNNFLSSANGNNQITQINFNIADVQNTDVKPSSKNALECCISCQNTANCIFSVFYSNTCNLAVGQSCRPGQAQDTSFNTESGFGQIPGFIVSNGPCGGIANGGNI